MEIPEDAYDLLKKIAREWSGVENAEEFVLQRKKGSMTNRVYECHWKWREGYSPKKVLVRVYGDTARLLFDRETEVITFERMSQLGYGPRLLGRFPNGRLEEFLNARTLTASDLHDPDISYKIAVKLYEFHHLDILGPSHPHLWERLSDWLEKSKKICKTEVAKEFNLEGLDKEISKLKQAISTPEQTVHFCHNDLQYGNIMIDEIDGKITIIDYEYASYNAIAFDIANFFCEMMADYHGETPHLLDEQKYPDFAKRWKFIEWYFENSGKVEHLRVERLMNEVDGHVYASHIHWGLWGVLCAHLSDIDFDYMGYARERFRLYHKNPFKVEYDTL